MALDSTQLAADRTRLAHERTLMAWVRTATSLISFGFAIDKFAEERARPPHELFGAHHFAQAMMWVGLISLVLATIQHVRERKVLEETFGKQRPSVALIPALLVGGLGILALLSA
jgi:putative membrane protein